MDASVRRPTSASATTRFPGLGSGTTYAHENGLPMMTPRTAARTDDDGRHEFERWKETIRAQDEDTALLHHTVVTSKKDQLEAQHERLAKQRAFIRQEKRKILLQNAMIDSEKERFEASLTSDWFCLSAFPTVHDRRITLDVGGQLFEISAPVAMKDPSSMLAALVADDSPLSTLECGCFRVDRDWWLFRYVLHFLRDGLLPQDPKLLRELYLESEFWKMDSLRKAIEMKNMELLQIKQDNDAKTAAAAAATLLSSSAPGSSSAAAKYHLDSALLTRMKSSGQLAEHKKDSRSWWLDAPTWWGDHKEAKLAAVAAAMKRAMLEEKKKGEGSGESVDGWWKSSTYRGKEFALDTKREKVADGEPSPRSPLVLSSTWPSTHHGQ